MNIKINKNIYGFKLDELVEVGGRLNNPKRNFLFVSKILGKHLLINPKVCKTTGFLLANLVYEDNNFDIEKLVNSIKHKVNASEEFDKSVDPKEKVLVIGFAETATALGMSTAYAIKDSYYINTTREIIKDEKSFFNFEEEHSHATSHKCYLRDLSKIENADRVILIDDEITTGNTMLNLIKEFNKLYPNKKYTVLSLLDFRNDEYLDIYEEFKREYNLEIDVKSFIAANIEEDNSELLTGDAEELMNVIADSIYLDTFEREKHLSDKDKEVSYIKLSGRFGVSFDEIRDIETYAKEVAYKIDAKYGVKGSKVCVLGHGEDMYIPSVIASYLGDFVSFKTTTRSPIFTKQEENYPIKERGKFYVGEVPYYIYNKTELEKDFDFVFVISEFNIKYKLTKNSFNIII